MPSVQRVKSGCITCRIRKIKCDETKPHCGKCTSSGRKCDGYSLLPFSRRELTAASVASDQFPATSAKMRPEPLLRLVSDPAFGDVLERRHFQYFRTKSVVSANALVASQFWDRTVLQACHATPAIKHAVLALSSWHQAAGSQSERQLCIGYADDQYRLALQEARSLVSSAGDRDVDRVLITCIVFICFEAVRGHYRESQTHMDHGRAICKQYKDHFRRASRRNDLSEISRALDRLDLPVLGFSDANAPYHYSLQDFHETDPTLALWDFRDVYEARTSLVDLSRWLLVISHYMEEGGDAETYDILQLQRQKQQATKRLSEWHERFERIATHANASCELLVLNLRQWYEACMVLSDAELVGPETRYDCLLGRFEKIVNLGRGIVRRLAALEQDNQVSISYDVGYLMPCFMAAQRCRDSRLRRQAIELLLALPRQEGVWGNYGAAAIAQRWVDIEEQNGTEVIAESERISSIETRVFAAEQEAHVVFKFADGGKEERKEVVKWSHLVKHVPIAVKLQSHT